MPESTPKHPRPATESEDDVAIRLLGIHPLRTEIYRLLAERPDGATAADLANELGVHHRTIRAYLHKMESEGALTSDDSPEPLPPHWRAYQLNPTVRDAAIHRYVGYINAHNQLAHMSTTPSAR